MHHSDFHTELYQTFGSFEAKKTSSNDSGFFILFRGFQHDVTIRDISEADDSLSVMTRYGKNEGAGADIDEPNSLLVSKALPNSLIRLLQTILLPVAVFVYFYVQAKPWNLLLAILIAMVSFLPSRSLRKVLMFAIGLGLVFYGHAFAPWNLIAGSLLMLCTTLTHRGLTHTLYGTAVWAGLLYSTAHLQGPEIWVAGGTKHGAVVENVCIVLALILAWIAFSPLFL
ncbi:hypothetical protein G195_000489 [Phytophthora kernoviae 00238/432]|uniref:Uncharacterized protein n=1 Tax=Phytophthora kernoviae 00238/432 TaxID=1284355 RepID=A0A8J4WBQ3_9STRA|nr:hypothetical protein G195_000489 [Phytophthora kernoviae 00238/432]